MVKTSQNYSVIICINQYLGRFYLKGLIFSWKFAKTEQVLTLSTGRNSQFASKLWKHLSTSPWLPPERSLSYFCHSYSLRLEIPKNRSALKVFSVCTCSSAGIFTTRSKDLFCLLPLYWEFYKIRSLIKDAFRRASLRHHTTITHYCKEAEERRKQVSPNCTATEISRTQTRTEENKSSRFWRIRTGKALKNNWF